MARKPRPITIYTAIRLMGACDRRTRKYRGMTVADAWALSRVGDTWDLIWIIHRVSPTPERVCFHCAEAGGTDPVRRPTMRQMVKKINAWLEPRGLVLREVS